VVRRFLLANAAWEGTFAAARTFVVLYVVQGLGESVAVSSTVLAAVAGGYVVAAIGAGWIAQRVGIARTILLASLVYGCGYLAGGLATEWNAWYLAPIFVVAIGGGLVMTLAWSLLFTLMPEGRRGAVAGLATTTKGLGLLVGPLAAGAMIDLFGYRLLWPVCAVPVLAAVPLVASLARSRD
jgi:MFS family permease